ncbi:MAG: hypothetical protein P8X42_18980 [Calditrichaceae bacterium]
MAKEYHLTEEQKKQFAGIYLLDYMINTPKAISIFLDEMTRIWNPFWNG